MKVTKYEISVFLLCSLFCFFSCSKEDPSVIGSWGLVKWTTECETDPQNNISFSLDGIACELGDLNCSSSTFIFYQDGQYEHIQHKTDGAGEFEYTIKTAGTYSIDGNTLTDCENSGLPCVIRELSFDDGNLILTRTSADGDCMLIDEYKKL